MEHAKVCFCCLWSRAEFKLNGCSAILSPGLEDSEPAGCKVGSLR